jgi:hypothetical protein
LKKIEKEKASSCDLKDVDYIKTNRLATISFSFRGIKVDINYFGVQGVLNSQLLKCYVLCDSRFPILAYNIKKLIGSLGIKNKGDHKYYINSYSWMLLLITYLQDIVNPPVLPKILKELEKKAINIEIFKKTRIDYKNKNKYHKQKDVDLKDLEPSEFILRTDFESKYREIYNSQITTKNDMSLAELWIGFIEFVTFYARFDLILVDAFDEYYISRKEYDSRDKKYNIPASNKTHIAMRDPFDHTYNPTNVSKSNYDFIIEKLKKYSLEILG